ncbi:MAG: zinc-dependent peptidase, partial [Campylobacterota bacterium]
EGSNYQRGSEVFSETFNTLKEQFSKEEISQGALLLGSYALKNEAEFFAVCSERFFETPQVFKAYFPDIYHELKHFYRLDTEQLFKPLL